MDDEILRTLARIETKLDIIKARLSAQPVADDRPLLTIAEASKQYKLAQSTLYKLKSVHVRMGRRVRISPALMDRYCQRVQ